MSLHPPPKLITISAPCYPMQKLDLDPQDQSKKSNNDYKKPKYERQDY